MNEPRHGSSGGVRALRDGLELALAAYHSHQRDGEEAECEAEHVAGRSPCPAHSPAPMNETEADQHRPCHSAKALAPFEWRGRSHDSGRRLLAGNRRPGIPGGEDGCQNPSPSRLDESGNDEGYHEQPGESLNPAVPYQALLQKDFGANRSRASRTHKDRFVATDRKMP